MKTRIIIETECEDIIEMINIQVKCGRAKIIIEDGNNDIPLRGDEEICHAIQKVIPYFAVNAQWVAIYRILVDFYGFPKAYDAFCKKMKKLMSNNMFEYTCVYQAIQKGMLSKKILSEHYSKWLEYKPLKSDVVFPRQKKIADMLLSILRDTKFTLNHI